MVSSFLFQESSQSTYRFASLPTAVLAHGALLPLRCLPTAWCVVDLGVGDHKIARPPTHTISTSAAGRHRRTVYRGAIVLTSFSPSRRHTASRNVHRHPLVSSPLERCLCSQHGAACPVGGGYAPRGDPCLSLYLAFSRPWIWTWRRKKAEPVKYEAECATT
jgi:hypothetical protein